MEKLFMFDLSFFDDWNFWRGFILCFSFNALFSMISFIQHGINRYRAGYDCHNCMNWDCSAKRCAREWGKIEQNKN